MRKLPKILLAVLFSAFIFSGCSLFSRSEELPEPTNPLASEKETTAVSVFYPTGKILIEERHVVPLSDNLPLAALRELFTAEPKEHQIAVILPKAKVNSVKVDKDGTAYIDFNAEILNFPETDVENAEIVAFAAIVETLKQFDDIKRFVITVEGKEKGQADGKSIEDFWGKVTLKKQPINIIRSISTTETAEK